MARISREVISGCPQRMVILQPLNRNGTNIPASGANERFSRVATPEALIDFVIWSVWLAAVEFWQLGGSALPVGFVDVKEPSRAVADNTWLCHRSILTCTKYLPPRAPRLCNRGQFAC